MSLAKDPGRTTKPTLIGRILAARIRSAGTRVGRHLGTGRLKDALPDDWRIPDSDLARKADAAARALCEGFIIDHSYRTYCFAALFAARDGLKVDREIVFIASILHDLGLSEAHKNDKGSFEWVSARLAHQFCIDERMAEDRAELVHNAVALHSSLGIADTMSPEIAMVHFGAGTDLFGMRIDDVPARDLAAILDEYPRETFKACFGECLQHQAKTKPDSHIAGAMGLGLSDMILPDLRKQRGGS